jgi:hypothetical protein
MLWNIAVGLTIFVAFGSVLFALWNDREERRPSERTRATGWTRSP